MFNQLLAMIQTPVFWIIVFVVAALITTSYLLRQHWVRIRALMPAASVYPWWGLNALSYRSEINLALGAVIDFLSAYLLVLFIGAMTHTILPRMIVLALALFIGSVKYAWSMDLGQNHVPTFSKATVSFLERIVPSGLQGNGLLPGYYWFPLGRPFYKLALTQDVREFTVEFTNMQVWARNSSTVGQGAVEGETSGIVQFKIIDPGKFNSIETPRVALDALVVESARDVSEQDTIEQFICTKNEDLAKQILKKIKADSLVERCGVEAVSANVKKTDNKNETVKDGWAQVNVQRSTANARATDAAARIRRVRGYTRSGIDANRAAALDAVASDKAGATIGDQRLNLDVGQSMKDLANGLISRIGVR